jgi:hypothetical protein
MSIKAKLKISLFANDTIVAETEDPALWQKVLLAINCGATDIGPLSVPALSTYAGAPPPAPATSNDTMDKFAKELGISRDELDGACAPTLEPPYLHLDRHCWEAMKKQTPERGPTAYSAIAVSATLLALWFKASGQSAPTLTQAQAVLGTIDLKDQNAARGIERTEWLQSRPGGTIVINPSRVSQAVAIAKSFCSKSWAKVDE